MSLEPPAIPGLDTLLTGLEDLSVPACFWNGDGMIVASNTAARVLWREEKSGGPPGFLHVRKTSGMAWHGWAAREMISPHVLVGECLDGSLVEYLSIPSVRMAATGRPAGILEILVPLSAATIPRTLVHGLSNALGVILGNVDLALLEVAPDHGITEYLLETRSAALRARSLIREETTPVPATAGETESRPARARVMCVDDDEAFLLLACRALRRLGCDIHTYASPDIALSKHIGDPQGWDLVLIDNNLLGREGVDVAREFLRRDPDLRVCITSGAVDEDLESRAREAGVCRVIPKPATMSEFAKSVGDLLAGFTQRPSPP